MSSVATRVLKTQNTSNSDKTLTKQKIAEAICKKTGISKVDAEEIVASFFNLMIDILASGEMIKISGLGNFDLIDKAERPGRNPRTGVPTAISARRVVTFRPGNKFKARIEGYDGRNHKDNDGRTS